MKARLMRILKSGIVLFLGITSGVGSLQAIFHRKARGVSFLVVGVVALGTGGSCG